MDLSLGELQELELVTDGEAWRAAINGVAKSRTRLSDWTQYRYFVVNSNLFFYTQVHLVKYFFLSFLEL